MAQLGPPDMRLPIQYALTYPDRAAGPARTLDPAGSGRLSFGPLDRDATPPSRRSARGGQGGNPARLSAADDVAVDGSWPGGSASPRIAETICRTRSTPTSAR